VYNLANSDETEKLIAVLKEELAAIRYEVPKAEASLETWQDENSGTLSSLKSKLTELENSKKTKSELYKTTMEEFSKLQHAEDARIFQMNKLTAKENQTIEFLMVCDERLGINLENDLDNINSRISFLESERQKYEQQKINLVKENKTDTDDYLKITESVKNKVEELNEALEKKKKIIDAIEKHKMLESKY
jgi:chromosome segregation ATPase